MPLSETGEDGGQMKILKYEAERQVGDYCLLSTKDIMKRLGSGLYQLLK